MGQKSYPFAYKLLFVFCGHVSVGFSSFFCIQVQSVWRAKEGMKDLKTIMILLILILPTFMNNV